MLFSTRLLIVLSLSLVLGSCSLVNVINSDSSEKFPPGESGNIRITERIDKSGSFENHFATEYRKVEHYKGQILTRTSQPLSLNKPDGPLNNLIADMLRWHVSRIQGRQIDVGYVPLHLLKDSLEQGPVKVKDVYRIIPRDTKLAIYRVNGIVLQQLADTLAVRNGGAISGIRFRIKGAKADDILVGTQPIQYESWYRLAAPAHLFCAKSGELTLNDTTNVNITLLDTPLSVMYLSPKIQKKELLSSGLREVIINYMSNQELINRNPDYRIR